MAKKTKKILLRNVPDDIIELMIGVKNDIMSKTKRLAVSDEEAIYKLIRNAK